SAEQGDLARGRRPSEPGTSTPARQNRTAVFRVQRYRRQGSAARSEISPSLLGARKTGSRRDRRSGGSSVRRVGEGRDGAALTYAYGRYAGNRGFSPSRPPWTSARCGPASPTAFQPRNPGFWAENGR